MNKQLLPISIIVLILSLTMAQIQLIKLRPQIETVSNSVLQPQTYHQILMVDTPMPTPTVTPQPVVKEIKKQTIAKVATPYKNTIRKDIKELSNRGSVKRIISIKATAYDLSYASCGKRPSHPQYGVTASGYNLRGKGLEARVVAIDPRLIPLRKYIKVEFENDKYQHMNGWWYTGDTGSAVKGKIVDFYLGESQHKEAKAFGRQSAKITMVSDSPNEP